MGPKWTGGQRPWIFDGGDGGGGVEGGSLTNMNVTSPTRPNLKKLDLP